MHIRSLNTLPVPAGIRPDTPPPQPVSKSRSAPAPAGQSEVVSRSGDRHESRRPPLFRQAMTDGNLSRTGEAAVRTYREVAMSGDEAELVNRVNVVA